MADLSIIGTREMTSLPGQTYGGDPSLISTVDVGVDGSIGQQICSNHCLLTESCGGFYQSGQNCNLVEKGAASNTKVDKTANYFLKPELRIVTPVTEAIEEPSQAASGSEPAPAQPTEDSGGPTPNPENTESQTDSAISQSELTTSNPDVTVTNEPTTTDPPILMSFRSASCEQFETEFDDYEATFSFNFTKKEGNMALAIKFVQEIGGIQFPNMTSPVTLTNGRYWFDNSETKFGINEAFRFKMIVLPATPNQEVQISRIGVGKPSPNFSMSTGDFVDMILYCR